MDFAKCLLFGCLFLVTVLSTEAILTEKDENFFGVEADRYDWSKHPCRRQCKANEKPKTCYYVFVVEQFSSMSKACYNCPQNITDCFRPHCIPADGRVKTVYTINRRLPGPQIEVCLNDRIKVEVRNTMLSESTTIHWHGLNQEGTPYMDGVPFVNQCPILPGEKFEYDFQVTDPGTYFYHSHIGIQRGEGLFGALIVHPSFERNPHANLYDHDVHHIILTDWTKENANTLLTNEYYAGDAGIPETLLINGLGRFQRNDSDLVNNMPLTVWEIEKGKRYRFRLIDAGAEDCPIVMSIDNHTALVISLDSNDIEPVEVDAITIWPGERCDFVLKADQEIDNYWIRFRGYGKCQTSSTVGAYQAAILRYVNASKEEPKSLVKYEIPNFTNETKILNPYGLGTEVSNVSAVVNIPDLNSIEPNDLCLTETPDQQIYLNFDFYKIDNYDFQRKNLYGYNQVDDSKSHATLQFNHISLKFPPFPLLPQRDMVTPGLLCNRTTLAKQKNCTAEFCACTHVIHVPYNNVVELVLVDGGSVVNINHPVHLHGHFFRVIATENLKGTVTEDRIRQMDADGLIQRRLDRAPLKDTIKAPGGGYTIVRFIANNTGYWYFHCHFEPHNNIGMSLILKVGEHKEFPPVPKKFPKCGTYVM